MCAAQPQQPQHDAVTNTSPSRQQQHRHIDVQLQAIEDYRRFAAVTIQRYCRGWIVRLHKARQVAVLSVRLCRVLSSALAACACMTLASFVSIQLPLAACV